MVDLKFKPNPKMKVNLVFTLIPMKENKNFQV
jgi:hypothetical protein